MPRSTSSSTLGPDDPDPDPGSDAELVTGRTRAAPAGDGIEAVAQTRAAAETDTEIVDATLDASVPGAASESRGVRANHIGRYAVVRELGRGGMGIVYACYDEGLDRKVAVKLLLGRERDATAQARLEREAQALARLSHPNVVQIYELGRHDDAVFVAMEFIVGETLREWLFPDGDGTPPRSDWRAVVALLRQAGEGLSAAHAAGLVHRDFKSDNVMVGADGRPRVLDFGLVRDANSDDPESRPVGEFDATADPDAAIVSLTRTGAVMGTPTYMAPEQFLGQACGPHTDQFSFCVVAYEALWGERPFAGKTFHALAFSVCKREPRQIPADTQVPPRLRAAILRGLASDPNARWPDMASLLAEFDAVLGTGRKRVLGWAAAALVAVVAGGVAITREAPAAPELCAVDEAVLAGTWDSDRRTELQAAFEDHADSLPAVEAALDEWGERYVASLRGACEATRVRGTQSEAVLDARSGCLERQRREASAVVGLLSVAEGVGHAPELLARLPDLEACDDPRLAQSPYPMPQEPARREAILAAYEQISTARALGESGRADAADGIAESVAETAKVLAYRPLEVEAEGLLAERLLWRERIDEAVVPMREAIQAAEIAELDELSATLRTRLAVQVISRWGRPETQDLALEEAETAVARVGRPDDPRALRLELARVEQLARDGAFELALTRGRAVTEQGTVANLDDVVSAAERQTAQLLISLGRFDEAREAYLRSRARVEARWGPESTPVAELEADLGILELSRGRFEEAATYFAAARRRYAALLGEWSPGLGRLELAEGKLAFMRGDLEAAAAAFDAATRSSADAATLGDAWLNLGVVEFYVDDLSGSLAAYRRTLELYAVTYGPEHARVGIVHSNIGESLAASGDHGGALTAYAEALAILARALPPDHADLAFPTKGRGQSRLALGDLEGARVDLERALALHEANPGEPVERADVEWSLARVARALGDEARARTLATTARQRLDDLHQTEAAAEIDAWLDPKTTKHPR